MSPAPTSLYLESEFWVLVAISLLVPAVVFIGLIHRRKISRLAVTVVAVAGAILTLARRPCA